MIIHSYLTDGFYEWAKIFVKSYIYHNGEENKIFLSTRNLTDNQIKELSKISDCVNVKNKPLNIRRIANRAKMSVSKILTLKNHIEKKCVTERTYIWKQAISVEDRYRNSILEAMNFYPDEDYLIHFDIDMYFRRHLQDLYDIVMANDISIKFRLKSKLNRKVMGGLIGFKLNDKTKEFMTRWIHHIDKIPLYNKPMGYGQTSFYYTYVELKDKFDWGVIPDHFISPRFLSDDAIWSANTKNGKTKNLKLCQEDFKNRR